MEHYQRYEDYREHWLFQVMRKVALRRAGNLCERCRKKPATEVRHINYPSWGSFDTPGNLEAICHDCQSSASET